jgi:hypothetical protein
MVRYGWVMDRLSYCTPYIAALLGTEDSQSTKTSNFNTTAIKNCRTFELMGFVVNVSAVSGSSPTLDLYVQASNDNSTWNNVGAIEVSQIGAVGTYVLLLKGMGGLDGYLMRLQGVIGGTATPSFTLAIYGFGMGPVASGTAASGL